jgi:hypothetical protein
MLTPYTLPRRTDSNSGQLSQSSASSIHLSVSSSSPASTPSPSPTANSSSAISCIGGNGKTGLTIDHRWWDDTTVLRPIVLHVLHNIMYPNPDTAPTDPQERLRLIKISRKKWHLASNDLHDHWNIVIDHKHLKHHHVIYIR